MLHRLLSGWGELSAVLTARQEEGETLGLQLAQSWSCCCTQGSSWLIPACHLGCPGLKAWLRPGFPSGKQWEASPHQVQSPAELAGLLLTPSCGLAGVYRMWSPLSTRSLLVSNTRALFLCPDARKLWQEKGVVSQCLLPFWNSRSEIGQK